MNYVAIGQNAWGKGATAEDAIRNMIKAGGSRRKMIVRQSEGNLRVDPINGGIESDAPISKVPGYQDRGVN